MRKIIDRLKELAVIGWKKTKEFFVSLKKPSTAIFVGAIYPAYRFFKWNPMLGTAIATIPVYNWINKKFKVTPVIGKLIGFFLFTLLVAISWFVAEVAVLLIALAFVIEIEILWDSYAEEFRNLIPKRNNSTKVDDFISRMSNVPS